MNRLVLMITEKCNFRCDYCIQKDLWYSLDMSEKILNKSIELFNKYWDKNDSLKVDLFWWEPLLRKKQIYNLINKNKHFNYEITTNWSLLDNELIKFFNLNNVSIILSFDWFEWQNARKIIWWIDSRDLIVDKIKYITNSNYENLIINITPTIKTYANIISELDYLYNLWVKKITADCWDYNLFLNNSKVLYYYLKFIKNLDKNKFQYTYQKLISFVDMNSKFHIQDLFNTISISANWDIYIWENACHDKNIKMKIWNVITNGDYVFSNYNKILKEKLKNDKDLFKVLSIWLTLSWLFNDESKLCEKKFINYLKILKTINNFIDYDNKNFLYSSFISKAKIWNSNRLIQNLPN